jgi:hypothetical protein
MGNFQPSRTTLTGERVLKYATATAAGGGFADKDHLTQHIAKINGEIITTILLDIEGLLVSGTVKDVIGQDGAGAAYMTQITTAVNGIVYKAEIACIEAPAGSNTTTDLDLVANSGELTEDVAYDAAGTATGLIIGVNQYAAGERRTSRTGIDYSNLIDAYLTLANGSGSNSGGTYTAGKFIIKLWGASF